MKSIIKSLFIYLLSLFSNKYIQMGLNIPDGVELFY